MKEVMTSMDYEKLYKAYYLQVYSYTISLAKNRELPASPKAIRIDCATFTII